MGEPDLENRESRARWRVRTISDASLWVRLSPRLLAQADVVAPDGARFLVRIQRNSPLDLSRIQDFAQGDPVSALVNLVWAQAKTKGRTGWSIKVVSPETAWRAEREKFTQPVLRDALVVDIALAIVSAIERGDQLWDAD